MTAEQTGHVTWSPDRVRQRPANHENDELVADPGTELRLTAPFGITLPIRDVTP